MIAPNVITCPPSQGPRLGPLAFFWDLRLLLCAIRESSASVGASTRTKSEWSIALTMNSGSFAMCAWSPESQGKKTTHSLDKIIVEKPETAPADVSGLEVASL